MHLIKRFVFSLTFLIIFLAHSRVTASDYQLDSLIRFHGFVLDTISDAPNAIPVGAKIILERLPYGSEIGIISAEDSSGYFEYYLSFEHDYLINIKSDGHQEINQKVKTKEWAGNGELKKNYYLIPEWKEDQVIRLKKLIFEQGRAVISQHSLSELNVLAHAMVDNENMIIQLEGHTDWRGDNKSNMRLSEERVEAVKNYLVARGISDKRIKTKAFGGSRPLTREASLDASSINRRVEVRILKID